MRLRITLHLLQLCQAAADISKARAHQKKSYDIHWHTRSHQFSIGNIIWVHKLCPDPHQIAGINKNTIGNMNTEGKDVMALSCESIENYSLPFMMNNSNSEHSHDPSAYATSSTTQTFCR